MKQLRDALENLGACIQTIRYHEAQQRVELHLSANQVLSLAQLDALAGDCRTRNAALGSLSLVPRYTGQRHEELLAAYIPNLKYLIAQSCPATDKLSCVELYVDESVQPATVILNILDTVILRSLEGRRIETMLREHVAQVLGIEISVQLKGSAQPVDLEDFLSQTQGALSIEMKAKPKNAQASQSKDKKDSPEVIKGKAITKLPRTIAELSSHEKNAVFEGILYAPDIRKTKNKKIIQSFVLHDRTASIWCKVFWDSEDDALKGGTQIRVNGDIAVDDYSHEITATLKDIQRTQLPKRQDQCAQKRVELHLHSNMSSMDGIESVKDLIKAAKEFGHSAVAITDHSVVQAFPDAMDQGKKSGIKILYGMEGDLVDDTLAVLKETNPLPLTQEFVVFDLETTGLSAKADRITEIGAVKIRDCQIVERYSQLVNPQRPLSAKITELTGITDEMLKDQPTIERVLPEFMQFIGSAMLVAHNSDFDTGFVREGCARLGLAYPCKAIDTVAISRALLKDLKSHKLNLVAKRLGVVLENHHRAVDDAAATAEIFLKFLEMFRENGVETLDQVNEKYIDTDYKSKRPQHVSLLVQNQVGLKNLYKIVSDSHVAHFYKTPRILKSVLNAHREGILVGSACERGAVFGAAMANKPSEELAGIVRYYDYLEVMPLANNAHLLERGDVGSLEELKEINRRIVAIGEQENKLVVATGDVHYLEPSDAIIRDVLLSSQKFSSMRPDNGAYYFRTTEEMLEEFSYLGEETAQRVVIEHTNRIAEMIEEILPVPDGTYPPEIEGSADELRTMCYEKARRIYGDPLPQLVESRLERELGSIIGNGYAVMYIIAQKLVTKSLADGYLVGSRGSVGSSFAATMSDITEVNPLPPHYICPSCKYSEFFEDARVGVGMDLPDQNCPKCGTPLIKEGHDIPFEVFLGFKGDKEPDIDLNFAGEYQPRAHKYTEELFGSDNVFRAGTIGTVANKTAFGYVMNYLEKAGRHASSAQSLVLRDKCTGVKRTSGQHPGGVMIVPHYKDVYDFTPIQYPANDVNSGVLTTHFDYHSISGRILKLDILGHDVPTIIRMLEDMTGVQATAIPLDDQPTMGLFTSTKALGCDLSDIQCETGTLGIPEFGTRFVRQMLLDTKPTTFAELIRISGLSHGTDVWVGNAQDLVRNKTVTLKEVISTRDDIMNYLMQKGVEPLTSFKIMENVRKGKGLTDEHIAAMQEKQVPPWYIESCQKIKYMFPKAHASAYVTMSFRIAYFKLHHKEAFYATYFTTKAANFDLQVVSKGKDAILAQMRALEAKGNEITDKEKEQITVLESAYEMAARGVAIKNVDLYRSDATKFKLEDNALLPPLISIPGLGETVARKIQEEAQQEFISLEDLRKRTKASKTVIEALQAQGCLAHLPESNQLSFI